MALNPTSASSPSSTSSSTSSASALAASRAANAGSSESDDEAGFAAMLQRAEAPPAPPDPSLAAKSRSAKPADKSGTPDKSASTDKSDSSGESDKPAKAAKASDAAAPATGDPNALQWVQQQMAAAGAVTARPATSVLPADLARGIESLRKGGLAAKGLAADSATAIGATSAAAAAAAKLAGGKDAAGGPAGDALVGLGQGLGAGNSATDTRDSLAALLPAADATAMPVQAGAVGANPNAPLDAGAQAAQAAAPAQATLAMPPQSPAFAPALGQQIEVWMRDGIQHAEVHLTPQELGPIRVQIAMDGSDARVALHADVASTREALQQALPQLSDALGQAGLSLTGGGVSDQSSSQSQGRFGFGEDGAARSGTGGSQGGTDDGLGALAGGAAPPSTPRGLVDAYA